MLSELITQNNLIPLAIITFWVFALLLRLYNASRHFEGWISIRYLMKSKGRFIAFLNTVSIGGVAIGVAALIVVTGVMTGFGNNLREKIIGTTPHIMIEKETGIKNYRDLKAKINTIEGIQGASPYVQGNIFLENSGQALGLVIRGIYPETEKQITKVDQYLAQGDLDNLVGDTVIIGSELARYFGYSLGDSITLISPGSGIAGQGWRYHLKVVGIFNTGMADYDMNLILVNLVKAQEIFNLPADTAMGLGIKLDDPYDAKEAKTMIYKTIGYGFLVKTWIDINRNLFEALFWKNGDYLLY